MRARVKACDKASCVPWPSRENPVGSQICVTSLSITSTPAHSVCWAQIQLWNSKYKHAQRLNEQHKFPQQFFQPPQCLPSTPRSLQNGIPVACTHDLSMLPSSQQGPKVRLEHLAQPQSAHNAAVLQSPRNYFKERLWKGSCRNCAQSGYWESSPCSERTWRLFQEMCFFI